MLTNIKTKYLLYIVGATSIRRTLLAFLLFLSSSMYISAEDKIYVNTTDPYIEYTRTVYDTALVVIDRKLFVDSLMSYEKCINEIWQSKKKKIQNEGQRAALQFYLDFKKKSCQVSKTSPNYLISILLGIHKDLETAYFDDDAEDEMKEDLDKGKINQRLGKSYPASVIREGIEYLQDSATYFNLLIESLDARYKRSITEKIENPFFNLYIPKDSYGENNDYMEEPSNDWSWIDTEDFDKVKRTFPTEVTYKVYRNHSKYAVIDGVAYDKNGKLAFVKHCTREDIIRDIQKVVYRTDYAANKYGIKREPKSTQDYIKRCLGIGNKAPTKEAKQAVRELQNYAKNVTKPRSKTQRRYDEGRVQDAFLWAVLGSIDSKGYAFIQQLDSDHEQDFKHLVINKVDDVTISALCLNDKGQSTYRAVVKFVNVTPFKVKPVIIQVNKDHSKQFKIMDSQTVAKLHKQLQEGTYLPEK